MDELLRLLDVHLARFRPDYFTRLQPGLAEHSIDEFHSRFGLTVPSPFRKLYLWRNGQSADCSESLVDNWMFTPLEDVTTTKELLDGMIDSDFEKPDWWRAGWIPFLSNGGGDHLCLDLTAEIGGNQGQLLCFWHDWDNRTIKFPSIEKWVESVIERLGKPE